MNHVLDYYSECKDGEKPPTALGFRNCQISLLYYGTKIQFTFRTVSVLRDEGMSHGRYFYSECKTGENSLTVPSFRDYQICFLFFSSL